MCLETIAIHLGAHCPRLWHVIGQYKNGAKFLTIIVVILQLVRISFVGYEWKFITTEYPQTETIAFCVLSILLGFVSLGLEGLLLYAIQTNNLKKIQPWFLCTFLIFLTTSLAFVITGTLYIIRPIDHNMHLDSLKSAPPNSTVLNTSTGSLNINNVTDTDSIGRFGRDPNKNKNLTAAANVSRPSLSWAMTESYDYMMEEGVSSSTEISADPDSLDVNMEVDEDATATCAPNNLTCIKFADDDRDKDKDRNVTKWTRPRHTRAINSFKPESKIEQEEKGSDIMPIPSTYNGNSDENGSVMSISEGACTTTATSNKTLPRAASQAKKGRKSIQYIMKAHNETYAVLPILPLSFFLDVVRCIPQLFLVNRFVKAEQLHEHLIHPSHSHQSLSALYVKPLPVLV